MDSDTAVGRVGEREIIRTILEDFQSVDRFCSRGCSPQPRTANRGRMPLLTPTVLSRAVRDAGTKLKCEFTICRQCSPCVLRSPLWPYRRFPDQNRASERETHEGRTLTSFDSSTHRSTMSLPGRIPTVRGDSTGLSILVADSTRGKSDPWQSTR